VADTVMVIGGSGFIGSHLLKLLVQRGDSAINYDIRPWSRELAWMMEPFRREIVFEQGGVESWPRLCAAIKEHKVDRIVHAAAPVNLAYLSREPKVAFDVIAQGTVNVLEAVRLLDVKRLVFLSSIGVLPTIQYEPIDANHPTVMATEGPGAAAYGAGKLAGEAFCWAYRHAFDLDFVTIRPSAVYGFGSRNPIYIKPMVEESLKGRAVRFDSGREFPRDYTHVEDVVGVILAALDVPAERLKHRVFYAATGRALATAGELAEMVKEMIPSADIQIESGLSYADRLEIRYRGLSDIGPVKDQLGYELNYPRLRDGLAQFIASYRDYMLAHGETPADVVMRSRAAC
jgi:nucleoside-diphosphate-sugar epimerase